MIIHSTVCTNESFVSSLLCAFFRLHASTAWRTRTDKHISFFTEQVHTIFVFVFSFIACTFPARRRSLRMGLVQFFRHLKHEIPTCLGLLFPPESCLVKGRFKPHFFFLFQETFSVSFFPVSGEKKTNFPDSLFSTQARQTKRHRDPY